MLAGLWDSSHVLKEGLERDSLPQRPFGLFWKKNLDNFDYFWVGRSGYHFDILETAPDCFGSSGCFETLEMGIPGWLELLALGIDRWWCCQLMETGNVGKHFGCLDSWRAGSFGSG